MQAYEGHDTAWREWQAALGGPRLHHAWLLAGREGLGKSAFATRAALSLVETRGAGPDPHKHPDILWLRPLPANDEEAKKQQEGKPFQTKRSISVDQVREMQRRLVTRPTLGPRRAVIIDAADDLEKGGVNALLKSLEEPPAGTFFLLIAHQPGRLLPTVRSRCIVLRFHPLDEAAMARALGTTEEPLDPRTRDAAIAVGNGSPGAALAFAAHDLGAVWTVMTRIAAQGDADMALRAQLATALGQRPSRDKLLAALEAARSVLVAALRRADHATQLRIIEAHARLVEFIGQAPTYNFEPQLLLLEIGALLASAAGIREAART